jgi:hypothetical protein
LNLQIPTLLQVEEFGEAKLNITFYCFFLNISYDILLQEATNFDD